MSDSVTGAVVGGTGGQTTTYGVNPAADWFVTGTADQPGFLQKAYDIANATFKQPNGTTSTAPLYYGDLWTDATQTQKDAWADAAGLTTPDFSAMMEGLMGGEFDPGLIGRLEALSFDPTTYDSGYVAPEYEATTPTTDVSFSDTSVYDPSELTAEYEEPTDYTAGDFTKDYFVTPTDLYKAEDFTGTYTAPETYTPGTVNIGQVGAQGVSSGYTGTAGYQPGQITSGFEAPDAYDVTKFESTFERPDQYTPAQYETEYVAPEDYVGADFQDSYFNPDELTEYTATDYRGNFDFTRPEDMYQAGEAPGFERFSEDWRDYYMNPYFEAAMEPQLREAQRAAEIQRLQDAARLTKAGAFGGSRQAIMESELNRNLMQNLSDIRAKGYNEAYQQAREQFTKDEQRKLDTYATAELARQKQTEYGLKASELESMYSLRGAELTEQSKQFLAKNELEAADLAAKYGLEADNAVELSRQFAYGKKMDAAKIAAEFGLDKEKAQELSRQFGAVQDMKAAELAAQFDLDADKATELSKQFAAEQQLSAAKIAAELGLDAAKATELAKYNSAQLASKEAYDAAQLSIEAQKATQEGKLDAARINTEAAIAAAKIAEESRQFGYTQEQRQAEFEANYGLDAYKAEALAKQFESGQTLDAAELEAKYGLSADQAQEVANQFEANYQHTINSFKADFGLKTWEAEELANLQANKQEITVDELQAKYGLAKDEATRLANEFKANFEKDVEETAARLGMEADRYSDLSKQFGAEYGLKSLQTQLDTYAKAGQLQQLETDAGIATLKLQLAAGADEYSAEHAKDVAQFEEWMRQQNYPREQVQFMRDIFSGLPATQITTSAPETTALGDLIGAIGGIGSLINVLNGAGGQAITGVIKDIIDGLFGSSDGANSGDDNITEAIADGATVPDGNGGETLVI